MFTPDPTQIPRPVAARMSGRCEPLRPGFRASSALTSDVPGTGGVLKERADDFLVEEIPAYEPCGEGEHVYLFVEKRELSTMQMVRIVAEHFGVRRDAVGVAGLKDKKAVTRQVVSVHVPGPPKKAGDFPELQHPQINILWVDKHTNKLRRGHLKGNRFVIRVRGVEASKAVYALKTLRTLARLGTPNRVGEQRFGVMQTNADVGRAILLEDHQAVLDAMLGVGEPGVCPPSQLQARELYQAGDFAGALAMMPHGMRSERRVLAALARGANAKNAAGAIERLERSFYVTAFQSAVFNKVLDERIAGGTLGTLVEGDLALKHENGAMFAVDGAMLGAELTERVAKLEISPSGPMWGVAMMRAGGAVDAVELAALEATGVKLEDFERLARTRLDGVEGQRRPLRVPVMYPDVEGGMDEHGSYVRCTFELPRGAFATSVMQEVMKVRGGDDEHEE